MLLENEPIRFTLVSEQLHITSWQELNDPKRVYHSVLTWKRVLEGIQADMHKYTNKLDPIAVPTTDVSLRGKNCRSQVAGSGQMASESCLSSILVSEAVQKLEDAWSATDVRELNTWVLIVMMSNPVVTFIQVGVPGRGCGRNYS